LQALPEAITRSLDPDHCGEGTKLMLAKYTT